MCSFVLWHRIFSGYPVVVAANRDEALSRPSTSPFIWEGSPAVLAPRDDRRGGTWLGVNPRGLLIGLTNRHAVPSRPGLKSRGLLPLNGLELASAAQVAEWVTGLDAREYNGVHLVAADPFEACLIVGGGADGGRDFRVRALEPGMHVVTNFGLGQDHPRGRRIVATHRRGRMDQAPPRPSTLAPLLDLHELTYLWGGEHGPDATCVHRPPEEDYGTKSSSIIRLNPGLDGQGRRWQWWNRERGSPSAGACLSAFRETDPLLIDADVRLYPADENAPA